jgi:putative Mg2+ transporter-C (MgtC) family protein
MNTMNAMDAAINNLAGDFFPVLKMILAIAIGILIGWEREYRENFAGMRVLPLVAVGATLFSGYGGISGRQFANAAVAGGVVTGIGFLGAGVILHERGALTGVTTAAAIWVTAAIGMGIALGLYVQMGLVTAAVLFILWYFPNLSQRASHNLFYEVIAPYDENRYETFARRFGTHRLRVLRHSLSRNGDQMICVWYAHGSPQHHEQLSRQFINDQEVTEFNTKLN